MWRDQLTNVSDPLQPLVSAGEFFPKNPPPVNFRPAEVERGVRNRERRKGRNPLIIQDKQSHYGN